MGVVASRGRSYAAASSGVGLPAMSIPGKPGESGPPLTLPHGDPVAVELIGAVHGGDVDAVPPR
jgi:hypothetical protein